MRRCAVLPCWLLLVAALNGCATDKTDPVEFGASSADCARPYADSSPWNQRLTATKGRPAGLSEPLTSDPEQYTYPVYEVTNDTPLQTVRFEDWYSRVVDGGRRLINVRGGEGSREVARVPIPPQARAAAGSDAQVILVNRETGVEWDMSHFRRARDGTYEVLNVGRYDTAWSAVPPRDHNDQPYFLRGAKIPYLAGLVRPCEIAQGRIDHALAFAYPDTTSDWIYPATHSDGTTRDRPGLPEGTRLQLDPSIDARTLRDRWGCRGACFTIARALQRYGMILIDGSGRSKLIVEYESTAHWKGKVEVSTPSAIAVDRFRVVEVAPPPGFAGPRSGTAAGR